VSAADHDRGGPPQAGDDRAAQREAEITREVTDAVSRDLARRYEARLVARDDRIAALERELATVYEQLDQTQRMLERWESHAVLRALRAVRRRVRKHQSRR
jgi:hypothetical protein